MRSRHPTHKKPTLTNRKKRKKGQGEQNRKAMMIEADEADNFSHSSFIGDKEGTEMQERANGPLQGKIVSQTLQSWFRLWLVSRCNMKWLTRDSHRYKRRSSRR